MTEESAIPNAKKFMSVVLRGSNYNFSTALADLVDNSIQAEADTVDIYVDFETLTVSVLDNGTGMTDEVHLESMKVASETRDYSENDLGKYGTGMKAASFSQADRLIVATKHSSNPSVLVRCLDLDHINRVDDWNRLVLKLEESDLPMALSRSLHSRKNGTAVIWEKMSQVFESGGLTASQYKAELLRQIESAEEHISMVFHRFLSGEVSNRSRLAIRINGEPVLPWDPFCRDEKTWALAPFSTQVNNSAVTLTPFVLPPEKEFSSQAAFKKASGPKRWNESQGFYVYRNDRLIRWGGWLRMRASDEHRKLARIALDFPSELDSVLQVDVSKSQLTLPFGIKSLFENTVKDCTSQAEKRYRQNKKQGAVTPSRLPGRGAQSADAVQRKMTAQALANLLEQVAENANLDNSLKKLKGALSQESPQTAKEIGWDK